MVAYFQRVVPQLTFASNQLNKGVPRHHTAAKLHHHQSNTIRRLLALKALVL